MAVRGLCRHRGSGGPRRQRLSLQLGAHTVPCSHTQPKPQTDTNTRGMWGEPCGGWGLVRSEGWLVRGRPLTSDGGAFCKGNRERQVNATGEGPRGQEPPLSLCGQCGSSQLLRAPGWGCGTSGRVLPAGGLPRSGCVPRETAPLPSSNFGGSSKGLL